MPVRIRLARGGHKNLPFYRIMAAHQQRSRDGKFLEILGSYCPLVDREGCKHLKVNTDRFKYWMAVGAQPSDTVVRLLSRFGLLPAPPSPINILAKAKEVEAINPSSLQIKVTRQKGGIAARLAAAGAKKPGAAAAKPAAAKAKA